MNNLMAFLRTALSISVSAVIVPLAFANNHTDTQSWQELFNGKDLSDWTVKITGQPFGKDKRQTFRVEDGLLKVRYDNYEEFANQFGHLFFQRPFSRYELLVEYRFVGNQLQGGPTWAKRNSGVMLHAQDPATMTVGQDFPHSIEAQLLGGLSDNKQRPTGNVCTPGTDIMLAEGMAKQHCSYSSSDTFNGDQWVQIHIVVDGHGAIEHRINNDVVMVYHSPRLTADAANALDRPELALKQGYIALQSESHAIDFRRVALRPMD